MIKPVDAVAFQKINSLREVNNDKKYNIGMDIIDEGALDKSMEGREKLWTRKPPGRKFMRSLLINTSNNQMFSFQKSIY